MTIMTMKCKIAVKKKMLFLFDFYVFGELQISFVANHAPRSAIIIHSSLPVTSKTECQIVPSPVEAVGTIASDNSWRACGAAVGLRSKRNVRLSSAKQ